MAMNWEQSKRVFQQAIALPESARNAFVVEHCDELATRQHVLQLLAAHASGDGFLKPPVGHASDASGIAIDPLVGRRIGDFLLEECIGVGGMGVVFKAVQENPDRTVAVKVLRHDIPIDNAVLQRFRNESELLAKLQHPNIAHVYQSGVMKDGPHPRPWFAVEWVEGCTLAEYLKQVGLTQEHKLRMMITICEAVSHAHSRGIIHRDLKPANILIPKSLDAQHHCKIVDFGIARATQAGREQLTMTHSILGTLDYLSPEQVADLPGSLDHRCDIFSLGVILFQMLVGELPFDRQSGSVTAVLMRIGSDESSQVRSSAKNLAGDLRLIVEKSLRYHPGQRYQTAMEFAGDIQRYLANEPVSARPPSIIDRTGKYLRRNKVLVGGAVTTILALAAGLVSYAVAADRANRAAADARYETVKAVEVSSYITNDFLTNLLSQVQASDSKSIGQVIDESASNIDSVFNDRPLVEAAVRNEVGTIYYNVRSFDQAASQYKAAWELWEDGLGGKHPDTLKALSNFAQSQIALGKSQHPETERLCRLAFDRRREVLGETDTATIRSLNNLAEVLRSKKRFEEAEALYLDGLASLRAESGSDVKTVVTLAGNLGSLYLTQGDLKLAEKFHHQSYSTALQTFGPRHQVTLQSGIRYVQTLDRAKNYSLAIETIELLLIEYERMSRSEPGAIFIPYRLAARIHRHQGDPGLAREKLEAAMLVAKSNPEKYAVVIKKIDRDLRRLE